GLSFAASNGATFATNSAPPACQAGLPLLNASSMTHWQKGSVFTYASSRRLQASAFREISASVTAGTMRSTIVAGKPTESPIQASSALLRSRANASTADLRRVPFAGRLSQDTIVGGGTEFSM